jgi:hypothetical protein
LQADSPPKKRQRATTDHFVAKPSYKAKMNSVRQASPPASKRKYNANMKPDRLEQLQAEIKSLNQKDVVDSLLLTILDHAAMTKEGRFGIAKALAKKQRVSLPAGGLSKAAVNKAKQTATYLTAGLASILHPDNPKQLQSMLRHDQLPTAARMHPQNPHSNNLKTVLPGQVQTSKNAATAVVLFDDEEPAGSVASQQPDSDSSNTSQCRSTKQTSHLKANRVNRMKLGRKSMTYKSGKQQAKAIEAVRKSLGDALIKHIQNNCKTVRERRPILALVALDHRRKDVNNALAIYTNSFEWRLCQIHAKYPGPIKPARKPLIRHLRIKKELLFKILAFLKSPGNMQRSAFGHQLKELLDSFETVEMDNVACLKKLSRNLTNLLGTTSQLFYPSLIL